MFKIGVYKGFAWVIYNARDEHDPLRTLVKWRFVYKGVMEKPT